MYFYSYGTHQIWGLTARIIKDFLEAYIGKWMRAKHENPLTADLRRSAQIINLYESVKIRGSMRFYGSSMEYQPIGVFDSGFGGLTVLKEIEQALPQYDYLYLGDNARAPYGTRSFETVYAYTLEAVQWLFDQGCSLVILACNTASAKALRTIQQKDLPRIAPERRVLGVIRPVTELVGKITRSRHVGILATAGTVASQSYVIEINKQFPDITVVQEACPMWVPLLENNEFEGAGADYFIKQHIDRILAADRLIDTIVLGCTHYTLLQPKISRYRSREH